MLTPAEVSWIRDHPAQLAELSAAVELTPATAVSDAARAAQLLGEYGRAGLEVVAARAKAAGKIPPHWITDRDAAQQATDPLVAAHRARRVAGVLGRGARVVDVTCSIGTELDHLARAGLAATGFDLDISRVAMARANTGLPVAVADALAPAFHPGNTEVVIADPARRNSTGRITDPDKLLPPLGRLMETYAGATGFMVKCAPGLDYSFHDGPVEVTSVDGHVKEVLLASSGLGLGARRTATLIRRVPGSTTGRVQVDTITDAAGEIADADIVTAPRRFIIDPDGAVVRAGLVRHYAAAHGLSMLDPRIAHVTGDRLPEGTTGFEIIEQVPIKKAGRALKAFGCGQVEILVRGVDVNPDRLRAGFKLKGSRPFALVITRIGRTGTAFICHPRTTG
ncbi:SAM-dependent methyltransferase [Corynebacterium mendelii]|uniref:SAM-dependent methyltransferase n=1 Tax=Corynebacterium mendelii TaxID=2765362 RepID=A0A939E3L3_9CORY|nr:class I SAM-dependent methyltransferase [Corynebacterium mendelii]MBN9644967.1 SAM-dependent methyltransferase [Corynebacterium mendelii]